MRPRICSIICSMFTGLERTLESAMANGCGWPPLGAGRAPPRSAGAWPAEPAAECQAGTLHLRRCRETPDRVVLRVESLEDGQELRNRQKIRDALRQIEQLQVAPLPADRGVGTDDFAKTRAVHVRDVREVQQNLSMALVDQAVDLVLQQFVALAQRDLALQVEHYDVADSPFIDLHGNAPRECACELNTARRPPGRRATLRFFR